MFCKSLIYSNNASSQTVATGGIVNFGSAVRKYGCNCYMSGGNVNVRGSGYYETNVGVTFTAGGNGTATIALYKNGIAIQGATASLTVTADSVYSLNATAIIRELCCNESTITAVITGVTTTITNATIEVKKL